MSLFGIFDTARSGISANQTALSATSNNIANVNTPGYSRQDIIMEIANPVELKGMYLGRGVGEVELRRHFDSFTFHQIIGQKSSYGMAYSLENGMSHIEQIFNETKDIGLLSSIQEYLNAWQDVADNPEGSAQRTTLLRRAESLVNVTSQIETDIIHTIDYLNDEIGEIVKRINTLSNNIATVNGKIVEVESGGTETANVFRDEREKLMKELAELVDYDWSETSTGEVTIVAGRRSLVAGTQAFPLSTALALDGDREIFSGGTEVSQYFKSGRIGGYLAVRDDIRENALFALRKLTASITKETNVLHYDGYGLDDSTQNDFFTPLTLDTVNNTQAGSNALITSATIPVATRSSLTLDEYDINIFDVAGVLNYEVVNHETGSSLVPPVTGVYNPGGTNIVFEGIDITITGNALDGDSFFISPVTKAVQNFGVEITDSRKIAASDASTAGGDNYSNNIQANKIIQKYQEDIANLDNDTYEEYYERIVSDVGALTRASKDNLEFEGNLLFELENRRESQSGVSLDEEAANLIRYQRAFEAGARLIKIADELLEVVINL